MNPNHASGRTRRLVSGIASSLVARGIGLLAPLFLIPFALTSIGSDRYGLWMAATSITAMALFSDLGIGNGLLTRLGQTYATGDEHRARQLIASGYAMTIGVGIVVSVLVVTVVPILNVSSWLDPEHAIPAEEANRIITICLLAFAINIPIGLIRRIQYGYQQVTYSNIWIAAASLASVLGFVTATGLWEGGAALAIAFAVFAVPLVGVINTLVFFLWRKRQLSPFGVRPSIPLATNLMRIGGLFFVLSIVMAVSLNIDVALVSRSLGLDAAAEYAVAWRVASVIALFVTLVNLPLWPANSEALAKGDLDWVKRATRNMTILSLGLACVGGLVLLGPMRPLIDAWLSGTSVVPSSTLLLALVSWNIVLAAFSAIIMVQNAAGVLWPQLVGWSLVLVVSIPLKWALLNKIGIPGAPLGAILTYIVFVVPLVMYGMRISLRKASTNRGFPETETAQDGVTLPSSTP